MSTSGDTICAIATPPGSGGVGIVRVSGPKALEIAYSLSQQKPDPRHAVYARFRNEAGEPVDDGILICFKAPHSFTGENIAELHTHGSPVVLDQLVLACTQKGARLARPGEFSERAFLNGKMDLTQAEAVADLINSTTIKSARAALASLHGRFSTQIHELVNALIEIRTYVEAAIDFPEEEIDFLEDSSVESQIKNCLDRLHQIRQQAHRGCLLRDGLSVTIIGRPNVGKSSLLNAMAGYEAAIVTDTPGTTRDLMRERIEVDGIPVHFTDSAGLRESDDPVEQEGIKRAWDSVERSQRVVLVTDDETGYSDAEKAFVQRIPEHVPIVLVRNKTDLTGKAIGQSSDEDGMKVVRLSARTGQGIDSLFDQIKASVDHSDTESGQYMARRRHLVALDQAESAIQSAYQHLTQSLEGELVAEELRIAQQHLGEITGQFTNDNLLDKIFRDFCIGK